MAENFSRHLSTRWVKSKTQSYDSWGDQYDDYGYDYDAPLEEVEEHSPQTPTPQGEAAPSLVPAATPVKSTSTTTASPLVLTIDRMRQSSNSLDEDSGDENTQSGYVTGGFPEERVDTRQEKTHDSSQNSYNHSYDENYHNERDGNDILYSGRNAPGNSEYVDVYADAASAQVYDQEENETAMSAQPTSNVAESHQRPPLINLAPISTQGLKDDSDFFPPTPTFSLKPVQPFTPETPHSDRSYMSDTDSIQREPDTLHLAYGSLNEIREELPIHETNALSPGDAPEELILTIDRMNLNSSDDSSFDDDHYNHNEAVADLNETDVASYGGIVDAEHAKARIVDSSDDDDEWGYHSEHSSNDELVDGLRPAERLKSHDSLTLHPVKTDALDSLIDDLLKMERLSTGYLRQPSESDFEDERAFTDASHTILEVEVTAVDALPEELPSLSSIHDLSLPDFEHHQTEPESPIERDILPPEFQKKHETFLSNVLSRSPSVRKAPPPVPKLPLQQPSKAIESDSKLVKLVSSSRLDVESRLEPVISSGSLSTGNSAYEVPSAPLPPPPAIPEPTGLDRRISTASAQTFNLGSWTPNTNMYRDQFVSQNDAESQMNVSIFNGNESNYNKFTGMRPPSGYAESFSNSSLVSVPETIDAPLPAIDEDGLDEEQLQDTTSKSFSQTDIDTVPTNTASVFNEHNYDSPKFKESTTPGVSLDDLPSNELTISKSMLDSDAQPTESTRKVSEVSSTASLRSPSIQKYPVFNWKRIMATSQPVDRLNLLRKAQEDEINYDTGLNYWLQEILKSAETSPHIQIGKIATQAYQNAQHSDIRRHTSIRSKVSLVKDKMETGHFASNLGRKFLSRGKKLMKPGSD